MEWSVFSSVLQKYGDRWNEILFKSLMFTHSLHGRKKMERLKPHVIMHMNDLMHDTTTTTTTHHHAICSITSTHTAIRLLTRTSWGDKRKENQRCADMVQKMKCLLCTLHCANIVKLLKLVLRVRKKRAVNSRYWQTWNFNVAGKKDGGRERERDRASENREHEVGRRFVGFYYPTVYAFYILHISK